MARLYDKAYCPIDHFKDKKCGHNDHTIYDAKFVGDRPIKFQPVCTKCGLVGMWARVGKDGTFSIRFPRVGKDGKR